VSVGDLRIRCNLILDELHRFNALLFHVSNQTGILLIIPITTTEKALEIP